MSEMKLNELDVVEKAKRIRKLLKAAFPNATFKVRSDRYSMGESVDVIWVDGPALDKIELIVKEFEYIDKDPMTGEILCGCNSFVHCHREISLKFLESVKQKVLNEFATGTFGSWDLDPHFRDIVWRELRKTDGVSS